MVKLGEQVTQGQVRVSDEAARLVTDDASTPARMLANAGDAFWACATWAGSAASKAASRSDGLRVSRAS